MSLPTPTTRTTAVVTGASSGIGTALAELLAARGYPLLLVARRQDRLADLAQRLHEAHRVEVEVRVCDLADPGARAQLCEELASRDVAVLCNNAGFGTYGELTSLDPARERRQVEVNVTAVHDLTLAVLPGMRQRQAGAILITGSLAGNQPGPGNATYAATKSFASTFAESLHEELQGTGVGCTLLAPGPVRTEFAEIAAISNVEKVVPPPAWVTAERAAELAIEGLATNQRRVVPGAFAKVQNLTGQHLPRQLLSPYLLRMNRRVR